MRLQFGKRIRSFLGLEDTPASYLGQAGKYPKVNAGEDALEFATPAGVGDMTKAVYDTNDDGVVEDSDLLEGSTKAEVQDHTPKAHKTSHETGQSDALTAAGIGAIPAPAAPAAGDVLYYDGSNWVRLAKDVGKYLKSAAAAAEWGAVVGDGDLSPARYWRVGEYHFSALCTHYQMNLNIDGPAGRIYATPYPIPIQMTFDRIGIRQRYADSTLLHLGIYDDDNGRPGDLVLDAGECGPGTTIDVTINQTLPAGLYWLAVLANDTFYVRYVNATYYCSPLEFAEGLYGHNISVYAAQAYGALPATFPAVDAQETYFYLLMLRRSA